MKTLLKLGLLLVVGILAYNYFLGTPAEKESAKNIFNEVKDLGKATWGLLKSEKEKLDEGKYDQAVDKIGDLFDKLKGKVDRGSDYANRLQELEDKRAELKRQLEELETPDSYSETRSMTADNSKLKKEADLKSDLTKLFEETETLMKDMEKQ